MVSKGGRERSLPFGDNTARSLDRYLRKRAQHPHARLEWLWIGKFGLVTGSGIRLSRPW